VVTTDGKRLSKGRAELVLSRRSQINRQFWPKRKHRIASRKLGRTARPDADCTIRSVWLSVVCLRRISDVKARSPV
jgi:hypothetical protein